jgi:hypothetical protein
VPDGGLSAAQWLKGESRAKPTDFYRSAARVGILGFLAATAYLFWWLWQLFHLAKRERFPRARAFWWILVPIYSWVVIYRQFEDLDKSALALGRPGLRANLPLTLLVLSNVAAVLSNRWTAEPASLIAFLVSSALTGVSAYLVQRSANDYLKTKYPDTSPRGISWGEITATVLGLLVLALAIAIVVFPDAFNG